jgi:hypothetical protein
MKSNKFIFYILLATVVTDSIRRLANSGFIISGDQTYYSAVLNYSVLIIMIYSARKRQLKNIVPKPIGMLFKLWLIINIVNLFRSFFVAYDYWDWKYLMLSGFSFALIPLAFFYGINLKYVKTIFRYVLKFLFLFGFLIIPVALATDPQLYPRLMIMVSFFILFIPYLKPKYKLLIIIVAVASILVALGFRTNAIRILFSLLILISWYFREHIKTIWLGVTRTAILIIPVLLLFLAVFSNYNIFREVSSGYQGYNIEAEWVESGMRNIVDDTRTFLYVEVLTQLEYNNEWILGESSVGSYKSNVFINSTGGSIGNERSETEVGFLNILLKYGLLGIAAYFLLLYCVSKYAIFDSNNYLSKMIGLTIVFRWTLMFVEEYTQFDLNFFFFWVMVGLVSSNSFREMTDSEIIGYFKIV